MMFRWAIVLTMILCLSGYWLPPVTAAPEPNLDTLFYTTDQNDETQLIAYDPVKKTKTTVSTFSKLGTFAVSSNGRIAWSAGADTGRTLYVANNTAEIATPTKIDTVFAEWYQAIEWSLDGRYLAFASESKTGNIDLYIWDGTTTINITPKSATNEAMPINAIRLAWGTDDRLAITAFAINIGVLDSAEVFLWDGKRTVNVSQNPNGEDREPAWSSDGRLAFYSTRSGDSAVYVWDTKSYKNSLPDVDTFIAVAPASLPYWGSYPVWTNTDLLTLSGQTATDEHIQIYRWDGKTATNISQNPTEHNGGQTWYRDGRWAFLTFFSARDLVIVRSADNKTLLTTEGQQALAWSPSGYLTFCRRGSNGWELQIWDGKQETTITEGNDFYVQWQNGERHMCTSG